MKKTAWVTFRTASGVGKPGGGLLAMLLIGLTVPLAAHGQGTPSLSVAQKADGLRSALGYDMVSLALLNVSGAVYDAIVSESLLYAQDLNEQQVSQLEGLVAARQAVRAAYGSADGYEAAVRSLDAKSLQVARAIGSLQATLSSLLTTEQQTLLDRGQANRGLEPPLAFVSDLTSRQRDLLKAAQNRRNRSLADPRNWHRQGMSRRADVLFRASVGQILTPAQGNELQDLEARLAARLPMVIDHECDALQASGPQARAPSAEGTGRAAAFVVLCRKVGVWLQGITRTVLQSNAFRPRRPARAGEPGVSPPRAERPGEGNGLGENRPTVRVDVPSQGG